MNENITSKAIRPREPLLTAERVPNIIPKETIKKMSAKIRNMTPRVRANSRPTEDSLRQWGQRARLFCNVLNKNDSWQCPHMTRHIPGMGAIAGVVLLAIVWFTDNVMIRLLNDSNNYFVSRIVFQCIPLRSRTGYSLSTGFTHKKTIAGTAHIFLARRRTFYRLFTENKTN